MFNHVMLGTNDIERARGFYDALLKTLGADGPPTRSVANSGHVRLFYRHDGNTLAISQPIDGEPATHANGSTLAFRCDSPERVRSFHDTAVAHGGVSIEDPPGLRTLGPFTYYLAYVRDPDGNKLCAIHRVAAGVNAA
jgi:catechol 2,3-dioxygenase-like lactoylglutathione lyase family enzyme